jgi:hypothetical protein
MISLNRTINKLSKEYREAMPPPIFADVQYLCGIKLSKWYAVKAFHNAVDVYYDGENLIPVILKKTNIPNVKKRENNG